MRPVVVDTVSGPRAQVNGRQSKCHSKQAGTPPGIDDGVACTDDSCDENEDVVVNTPNDTLCDDLAFCNGTETCDSLLGCQAGTPPGIDDGVACTDDSRDEQADAVVNAPNANNCDDLDPCTAESCDAVTGCSNEPIVDCGIVIPAGSRWSRVALVGLLFIAASCTRRWKRAAHCGGEN